MHTNTSRFPNGIATIEIPICYVRRRVCVLTNYKTIVYVCSKCTHCAARNKFSTTRNMTRETRHKCARLINNHVIREQPADSFSYIYVCVCLCVGGMIIMHYALRSKLAPALTNACLHGDNRSLISAF
jgi:hypothetical protein